MVGGRVRRVGLRGKIGVGTWGPARGGCTRWVGYVRPVVGCRRTMTRVIVESWRSTFDVGEYLEAAKTPATGRGSGFLAVERTRGRGACADRSILPPRVDMQPPSTSPPAAIALFSPPRRAAFRGSLLASLFFLRLRSYAGFGNRGYQSTLTWTILMCDDSCLSLILFCRFLIGCEM